MKTWYVKYYFSVLLLLSGFAVRSQHNDTVIYNQSTYNTFFENKAKDLKLWNEAPPVILPQHSGFMVISTTFFSTVWYHSQNLAVPANDKIKINRRDSKPRFYATSSSHWWQRFYDPAFLASTKHIYRNSWQNHHWRRNYNGVFSAHIINGQNGGNIVFALSHGENKNEKIYDFLYQNTVRPGFVINSSNPDTYSGGTPYADCWEAYFGFLNGNWASMKQDSSLSAQYFNDIGPVAWPSAGYVSADGEQLSQGLRHPSSIIHDGYIYIYVIDASMDGTGGVKLIRVKQEDAIVPQRYQTWSGKEWIAALPEGYTKDKIDSYFTVRGPANKPVITNDKNTIRFTVARFNESTNDFIAVEEYINQDNTLQVAFRYSGDLINWSEREIIYSAAGWGSSALRYPVFLNKNGLTDGSIDKEEFYVIGTRDDGNVTKLHFVKHQLNSPGTGSVNSNSNELLWTTNQSYRMNNTTVLRNAADVNFEHVEVFPVPTLSYLDISFQVNSLARIFISLFSLNGVPVENVIEETFLPQNVKRTLDFSNLKSGVYLLKVTDNNRSIVKKIIKL
ncbi:T9SS type A sorting domain-containing protein [Pontibacter cellulosilyticus]|uniref:T9SS type A sorting domain-containing protein n=1 Tax=Pontibacter cellulosilyticus TaxID=1720253 RepID=A0A923N4D3_9BACT|nr:T9SS type A sorting domain-containing protein [Pontibacter cellulosilyticus]MBC5992308.1 T9SS type A sorting domain-containing protein [Pontibacter cellulosilyticus]